MIQEQVPDLVLCNTYRLFLTKAFNFHAALSACLVITTLKCHWPQIDYFDIF